ncbi:tRNA 2-selenouridine(34) synthase MnmH [Undibacterium jejuense]|uniref:tRNA 2-selenouridine(34) synthase MnmH n=1 Tax=Undibacterium jejuense TaxID=1344949 RepID=A0A923KPF5_9BURK|nr:tRNA 2-selenouridine(34) synthase MnmH [Undibacterium jejuense]MBC3861641.1 tRNA 2-selenouridine(34) synthase MnmH [Undibacterium jejuense]
MKYPELIYFDSIAEKLAQFDCIIDVRSPAEFAEDHIPGAINCPVLSDEERIQVGTMYKQVGSFEAKRLGAGLVAMNIGRHLDTQFQQQGKSWRPLIYCWRGGNRSGSMAFIFSKIGWPVAQLQGGYKAYRQHVNLSISELANAAQWKVLCGTTGSGKSRLLNTLTSLGEQVLDLEQLAQHRGSVLGDIPTEKQPSQKMFESRIWNVLKNADHERTIYVEAESKKVGNLRVPEAIMSKIRESPCISISMPMSERVNLLMEDYAHFVQDPQQLNHQLNFLSHLHGNEKISFWKKQALDGNIANVVQSLLEEHYDPAYTKSIARNFSKFNQAQQINQAGLSNADFELSAKKIISYE